MYGLEIKSDRPEIIYLPFPILTLEIIRIYLTFFIIHSKTCKPSWHNHIFIFVLAHTIIFYLNLAYTRVLHIHFFLCILVLFLLGNNGVSDRNLHRFPYKYGGKNFTENLSGKICLLKSMIMLNKIK